jgi:prolyl-tRNA synthetase
MGCYGIGTTRLVGAIIEASHDDKGIIWPKNVAPFQVHITVLGSKDDSVQSTIDATAEKLYIDLQAAGVEVLLDDRAGLSAGEKFADADLLGMPVRVVVSEKSLKSNAVWPGNQKRAFTARFLIWIITLCEVFLRRLSRPCQL